MKRHIFLVLCIIFILVSISGCSNSTGKAKPASTAIVPVKSSFENTYSEYIAAW